MLNMLDPMVPLQQLASYQTWFELGDLGILDAKVMPFVPMEISVNLLCVPKVCAWCFTAAVKKRCSVCSTYYCDVVCQRNDWHTHRLLCADGSGLCRHLDP